jgi:hypothetical protein
LYHALFRISRSQRQRPLRVISRTLDHSLFALVCLTTVSICPEIGPKYFLDTYPAHNVPGDTPCLPHSDLLAFGWHGCGRSGPYQHPSARVVWWCRLACLSFAHQHLYQQVQVQRALLGGWWRTFGRGDGWIVGLGASAGRKSVSNALGCGGVKDVAVDGSVIELLLHARDRTEVGETHPTGLTSAAFFCVLGNRSTAPATPPAMAKLRGLSQPDIVTAV